MSGHSRYAPSSAKRNINCNGNLPLQDSLPDYQRGVGGDAAMRGTAAHKVVEHCLKSGKEPVALRDWVVEVTEESAFLRKNNIRPVHGGRVYEVDSDMIDGCDVATSYVRDRCEELGISPKDLRLETRTNPLPERDDTSGTADVTLDAWPTVLEVVDYKNGYKTVEHEANEQTLAYLLGMAIDTGFKHEVYRVTIVQPNAQHEDGRVRWFECDAAYLKAFQKSYRAKIKRCDEAAKSKLRPTDPKEIDSDWAEMYLAAGDHCDFCDAIPICPARRAWAQEQAGMDFDDDPPDEDNIATKSEEEVASILKWRSYFNKLFAACDTYAFNAMDNGYDVPGFKLVRGRSTRVIKPELSETQVVKQALAGKFFKTKDSMFAKPKLLSGPQLAKLVGKKQRKDFEDQFLFKPEGRLTVALDTDPREGVNKSAADDFEDDLGDDEDELDFG